MSTTAETLDRLEAEYRAKAAKIRADTALSWEHKEKAIKALGDEHHARRRELEETA
jgi:hypothetical protein